MSQKIIRNVIILAKEGSRNLRFKFFLCFFLIIVSGISEYLGIQAIFKIGNIISGDITYLYSNTNSFFGINYEILFLLFFILLVGFIRLYTIFFQNQFCSDIGHNISKKLFKYLIHLPFEERSHINSNEQITKMSLHVTQSIAYGIFPLFQILGNLIVVIGLCVSLVSINNKEIFVVILSIGVIYFIFNYTTTKWVTRISNKRVFLMRDQTSIVNELCMNSQTIELNKTQLAWTKNYKRNDKRIRDDEAKVRSLSSSPRFILESFGIVGAITFILLLSRNQAGNDLYPTLAATAIGLQKILVLSQSIYNSWNGIVNYSGAINEVQSDLKLSRYFFEREYKKNLNKFKNIPLVDSLELKNISYKYKNSDILLINNLNFKAKLGDIVGIIGKSGSGKSTLTELLAGLREPTAGTILINNIEFRNLTDSCEILKNNSSIMPQETYLRNKSIKENILAYRDYEEKRYNETIQESIVCDFSKNFEIGDEFIVGDNGKLLSGGQKQRINIARGIYQKRRILIFDESTSSLDPNSENKIIKTIKKLSKNSIIIFITHKHNLLEYCTKVVEVS